MDTVTVQDALDEAERLICEERGRVGGFCTVLVRGSSHKVSPAVWLAARAILIGIGYAGQMPHNERK